MSSNTNTLFWVITGAVVILSSFLLLNNTSDNTLNTISNEFNSLWTESINGKELPNNYLDENHKTIELDGLEIGVIAYNYLELGDWHSLRYYIKNISGERLVGYKVYLYLYDKDTDEKFGDFYYPLNPYFEPEQEQTLYGGLGTDIRPNYYLLAEVRK